MDQLKTIGAKYSDQPIYEEFQIEMNRISEICHYFQLIFFTCESCESLLKRKRKRRAHKKASWQSTWNNTKEILLIGNFHQKYSRHVKRSFYEDDTLYAVVRSNGLQIITWCSKSYSNNEDWSRFHYHSVKGPLHFLAETTISAPNYRRSGRMKFKQHHLRRTTSRKLIFYGWF